jgi:ParB family chromosome partitioning protein
MQNSSEFQYIAIDQLVESKTNPRKTFDQKKLEELAESIRSGGLIQPIVVRPKDNAFEIVAGARRFRAGQLAEQFSLPARIKELTDAQALEWQLVENSQREDVHPYEEAQGFQSLLDLPGYDVAALVEKSGKSASHIYARLSLLQLIPAVAEAFQQERITASHAALIARLPQEHQADAFDNCWRKDWQDKEAHLLPAKHLSAWIQTNLYLNLADAPFDREDPTLNPTAGACVSCPRHSGFNTSLFADVQGDQCKLCGIRATASVFCWLAAAALPTCGVCALVPVLLGSPPGGSCAGRVYCSPYLLGSLSLSLIGRSCACVAYVAVASWAILQHP